MTGKGVIVWISVYTIGKDTTTTHLLQEPVDIVDVAVYYHPATAVESLVLQVIGSYHLHIVIQHLVYVH